MFAKYRVSPTDVTHWPEKKKAQLTILSHKIKRTGRRPSWQECRLVRPIILQAESFIFHIPPSYTCNSAAHNDTAPQRIELQEHAADLVRVVLWDRLFVFRVRYTERFRDIILLHDMLNPLVIWLGRSYWRVHIRAGRANACNAVSVILLA